MSEEHAVTLDLLGGLMMNLQADLQVVSATMLRLDHSMDRLRDMVRLREDMRGEVRGVRDEMHEIRLELRAMHRQQQRLGVRVRRLEEGAA
jgi:hypothetical protein